MRLTYREKLGINFNNWKSSGGYLITSTKLNDCKKLTINGTFMVFTSLKKLNDRKEKEKPNDHTTICKQFNLL